MATVLTMAHLEGAMLKPCGDSWQSAGVCCSWLQRRGPISAACRAVCRSGVGGEAVVAPHPGGELWVRRLQPVVGPSIEAACRQGQGGGHWLFLCFAPLSVNALATPPFRSMASA